MTTTTIGNTQANVPADRRSLYWGITIAIVLALAVILTVQSTSTRDTDINPKTNNSDRVVTPAETAPPASPNR